ncbi:fimbria/pilus outer membrane usher protein [Providencia alcalifaciens]|uniref:fimbria/pilus outer membrane usher protein n=1 Tax=Providencia alcalifaciens TaxID=126385 RepID=UPI0032DBB3FE
MLLLHFFSRYFRFFRHGVTFCLTSALSHQAMSATHTETTSPSTASLSAQHDTVEFDVGALKALGYGAEVADFFKQGSQFLPGSHDVTVIVNGSARYPATVIFGDQGQLCVTPTLQRTLKLKTVEITSGCQDIITLYPTAKVTPHPNAFTVDVLVSESDFDPALRGDELTYGGFALLSNYRLYGMEIKGWDTQRFYQGQFETGANWQNWVLRNNSSFSSGQNKTEYQFNETTLTRSIAPWQAQLQLGQINTQGNLFGGTPLNGVQLFSDTAYQNTNKLVVPVVGVAQTPATVEVIQNNRLLYRTLVPAGPFELDRINGVVNGQPLQVSVIQDDGERQQFTVVTSREVLDTVMSEPVYQLGIGQYRQRGQDDDVYTPLIANMEATVSYQKTDYAAGLQWSDRYQSVGMRLARPWGEQASLSSSLGAQYAHSQDMQGQQWDASLSASLGAVSLGISSLYRTKEFPNLDEALQKNQEASPREESEPFFDWQNNETHMSNSVSLSWGTPDWGRVGYSASVTRYYGDRSDSILHTLSYARKIGLASLNVSYQNGNDRDNRLFLNVSVPLGQRASLNTQWQRYQQEDVLTSTFNHRPNSLMGYSVGVAHSQDNNRINGSVNTTTPYSQLTASGSWRNENGHSVMASASGALAYSDGLIATSPVALGDTFGILSVPGQAGVQVNTLGGGKTLTNHFGTAAIPTLPVNRKSTVQLDTKELPLNVRLDTTSFDVAVARGTVISRTVTATVMKQLLLGITLADGSPAPSGSSVLDEHDGLIGVVMGEGNVMLNNEQIGRPVKLRIANQGDCLVDYPVPSEFNPNMLYEEADAICR